MLQLDTGELVLAATDLTNQLACEHLTQQRLAVARGERTRPRPADDPHAELIRVRGEAHERAQLTRLAAECGGYVDLSAAGPLTTREALEAAAAGTAAAMRDGVPLIYQAQLFDGRWQGRADFLRRTPRGTYEVLDTKLARSVKPAVVHQLSLYSRLVAELQGDEAELAYVVLGEGSTVAIELRRYAALHRHIVRDVEQIAAATGRATYPEPVAHCAICALALECRARLVADDHLSLVAGARRDQRDKLVALGLPTVAALAAAAEQTPPGALGPDRFEILHHQAALQVRSRATREPTHRHLRPARATGYALLPDPSPGDVFFDLEGDPYVTADGIEYLWGWTVEGGYECAWAHDAAAEKAALERFVDRVFALRRRWPELHVYHYAPHERAKLRSLAMLHATREDEVDELLSAEILIDLYAVVRHAMQVGEESYSLKALERHHGFERLERSVREGGGSIVAYETWLATQEAELLEAIRAYNEDDCRSTAALRDWLLHVMRPEAAAAFDVDFGELRDPEPEAPRQPPAWLPEVHELQERLTSGGEELLAHLLLYHRREGKPAWWRYFDLRGKTVDELIDERDALARLVLDDTEPAVAVKRSLDRRYTFPPQEFKLDSGTAEDPTTREKHRVVSVADDHVILRRGADKPPPAPAALVGGSPIDVAVLREALVDLARSVDGRYAAVRALLRREPPRLRDGELGEDVTTLTGAALGLDRSVLPIQGPPGTGKTYRAARMIVGALVAGRRVGVTAFSHAAIQNLLAEIEAYADERGVAFAGAYKGTGYDSPHGFVDAVDDNAAVTGDHRLVAGTAWLFARPEHREAFDLLFVDEAGQFPLANAAAVGTAAESLVLLGDPQQLPQVTQADHPGGSGASVLEHILGDARTIAPDRGVLLTESWRMHPDVCAFVSERSYDGRLHSRAACARRQVAAAGAITGAGLRSLPVQHEGRGQGSPEEAAAIASACRDLLDGATVTDDEGVTRELQAADILVVAPYNMAVRTIRQAVPDGVRVGTVDRFQGQQGAVVFYAMTCSTGEDVPRGIDFLFDGHRLNVAVSRAQCLAVLVHSPRLLDADCATLEAMELVDGVCRFVEMAADVSAAGLPA